MNSAQDTRCRVGCPIRRSRDQRSLASPPGFSQRAASFIASQCQGIHQMPFNSRSITRHPAPQDHPEGSPAAQRAPENRRAQGQAPPSFRQKDNPAAAARMKTLFSDDAPHTGSHPRPRPVRLGHIHKSSSPFNQHRLRGPARDFPRGNPDPPPRRQTLLLRTVEPASRTRQPNHRAHRRAQPPMMEAPPMVEVNGIEPMTSCLQSRRSPN